MTWQTEFADFPAADMPAIPQGWIDSSWHNDTCPSFQFLVGTEADSNYQFARVWIAESDPELREYLDCPRFTITFEGNVFFAAFATDDWQEVLAYAVPRAYLAKRYRALVGYDPFLDSPMVTLESVLQTLAELESVE